MAIGTDAGIWFFGTEDAADDGATASIANAGRIGNHACYQCFRVLPRQLSS